MPAPDRFRVIEHGRGVSEVTFDVGFHERFRVPELIRLACAELPELVGVDVDEVIYFLSEVTPHRSPQTVRATWRQRVCIWLDRIAPDRIDALGLPTDRTVVVERDVVI